MPSAWWSLLKPFSPWASPLSLLQRANTTVTMPSKSSEVFLPTSVFQSESGTVMEGREGGITSTVYDYFTKHGVCVSTGTYGNVCGFTVAI